MPDMNKGYRFSFGPWNLDEGRDMFGPDVRSEIDIFKKLKIYKQLGFDAMLVHDDDAVPDIATKSHKQILDEAKQFRKIIEDAGLVIELCAPRLWEDERGIDGPLTSNDKKVRQWGIDRAKTAAEIARALGTDIVLFWLAREGTYCRESKDALKSHQYLIDAMNAVLEHDKTIRVGIEPKPNEPMDHAYIPSIGHALALGHRTIDPTRTGGVIETAHSQLAGFDASDDMAFALAEDKLFSVHLNDQNGLKFDQDKAFGTSNLRAAFNQVRILEKAGYKDKGMIAFDTKSMRTSADKHRQRHLENSKNIFLHLVDKVRSWDETKAQQFIDDRDYEALEIAVTEHLMGV